MLSWGYYEILVLLVTWWTYLIYTLIKTIYVRLHSPFPQLLSLQNSNSSLLTFYVASVEKPCSGQFNVCVLNFKTPSTYRREKQSSRPGEPLLSFRWFPGLSPVQLSDNSHISFFFFFWWYWNEFRASCLLGRRSII
jgi:hypothetical protein